MCKLKHSFILKSECFWSMLIYTLKFEGKGYENMKNLERMHPSLENKKNQFRRRSDSLNKKRLCKKFEQGKFEILWYSYFCLKFFRAFNWIPIVNIFLNLILIHSQISCIFAITDFPLYLNMTQYGGGWILKSGGESI